MPDTYQHFTASPDVYRAESAASSRLWNLWLPLLSVVVILVVAWLWPPFFVKWLQSEQTGLLEFIHFLFPIVTAVIALRLIFTATVRQDPFLMFWCLLMLVGGVYLGGEEASWGQHYFGWTTPEFWSGVNDQQETNLHNTSFLLDQWPRTLLKVGVVVGGLIMPWLLLNRPGLLPSRFDIIYPPLALVPLAIVIVITDLYGKIQDADLGRIFTLVRGGEFQELYIVWFILYYALFLSWRVSTLERGTHP